MSEVYQMKKVKAKVTKPQLKRSKISYLIVERQELRYKKLIGISL